jgi:NAD-reducing hydrogenase large subunit
VAAKHPDLARQGILMRRYGQEIIRVTAGKKIHGTGAIPGGINKNLSIEERDELLVEGHRSDGRVVAGLRSEGRAGLHGREPRGGEGLRLVRATTSASSATTARWTSTTAASALSTRRRDRSSTRWRRRYLEHIVEEVRDWSYMKFPFINSLGPEKGGTASARWRA